MVHSWFITDHLTDLEPLNQDSMSRPSGIARAWVQADCSYKQTLEETMVSRRFGTLQS